MDYDKDASNVKVETVEVSSQKIATNRSRKELNIAKSRSSRQRKVEPNEPKSLMAKRDAEQQLRDWQIQKEKERTKIELRRRQKALRLPLQQQQK